MNAEFNWWLLIVGLVLGAALTWLVMAESTRREIDLDEAERASEAVWIADGLSRTGPTIEPAIVEDVLRLHRDYLALPPPDEPLPVSDEPPPMPPPEAPPPDLRD